MVFVYASVIVRTHDIIMKQIMQLYFNTYEKASLPVIN